MLPISAHEGGKGGALLKEKYKKEDTAVRVPRSGAAPHGQAAGSGA